MKLEIDTTTPYPGSDRIPYSKYESVFVRMKPGHSIKAANNKEADRVVYALKKYLKRTKQQDLFIVRRKNKMEHDGLSRVWLLPAENKPLKMADVPGRKITPLSK